MAWSDQCKISFAVTVRAKRNHGVLNRSVNSIIKEISNESGIPAPTLHRWWADVEKATTFIKNDKQDTTNQNDDTYGDVVEIKPSLPKCRNGCQLEVSLQHRTNRPYSPTALKHGLCNSCISRARKTKIDNAEAKEGPDISIFCPRCGHHHYINQPN